MATYRLLRTFKCILHTQIPITVVTQSMRISDMRELEQSRETKGKANSTICVHALYYEWQCDFFLRFYFILHGYEFVFVFDVRISIV